MSGYTININGENVGTLYDDGDIYSGGKCVAHIYEDGDIYSFGSKIGSMGSDGSIWNEEGNSGYRVYDDGDIYHYGRCVGSIWGYERFLEQRAPKTEQSSSEKSDESHSGFAEKTAEAKQAASAAGEAGIGCGGIFGALAVLFIVLIIIATYQTAVHDPEYIVFPLLTALIVFIAYKAIKNRNKSNGASKAVRNGIGERWNSIKTEMSTRREQHTSQKAQKKAAREASKQHVQNKQRTQSSTPPKGRSYTEKAVYVCPRCGQRLSAPRIQGKIKITCPKCNTITVFDGKRDAQSNNRSNANSTSQANPANGKNKFEHIWAAIVGALFVICSVTLFSTGDESLASSGIVMLVFGIPLIVWFCHSNGIFGNRNK